jgi:hypothetical protein
MQPESMRGSDSSDGGGSRTRALSRSVDSLDDDESFGDWLRQHRERRKISIASIAESTKILAALLEGVEQDDVSRWPCGLYRRAFMRAYASAIGLDPEPVVRKFLERFPDPEETSATPAAGATGVPLHGKAPWAVLRLTLADSGAEFSPGRIVQELRRRLAAVAMDAFMLGVTGMALFVTVGAFWAPVTVAAGCYYFGSILILGNTPGVCLFASRRSDPPSGSSGGGSWRSALKAARAAMRVSTWTRQGTAG